MNAERLNNVLIEIKREVEQQGIVTLLQSFQSTFSQNINEPNQPNADSYLQAHNELKEALAGCASNNFSPSQRSLVTSIGGGPFVGNGLMQELEKIIVENSSAPGQAVTKLRST